MKKQYAVLKATSRTHVSVNKIIRFLIDMKEEIDGDKYQINNEFLRKLAAEHMVSSGITSFLKKSDILSKNLTEFNAIGLTFETIAINCINWGRVLTTDFSSKEVDFTPIKNIVLDGTSLANIGPYKNLDRVNYYLCLKVQPEVELPKVKDVLAEVVEKLNNDLIDAKASVEFWEEEVEVNSRALALINDAAQAVKTLP
jgi:hypothetical protein